MKRSFYTIGSLIILLIAAFVFVLVPVFTGRNPRGKIPAFGSYDGTEIRYEAGTDFADYVSGYADYIKQQGQEITSDVYYYIFNYAFNSTVTKIAYTNAVNKSGWKVPQTAVNRALIPYFTDENGNYSSRLYRQADPQAVEDLQKRYRDSLTFSRYADDCFGGEETLGDEALFGLKTPSAETEFVRNLNGGRRGFLMARFDMNDYPDSEKAAYGQANREKFVKYDVSVITCADRSKAEALGKRLANNEITFADAVGEYSTNTYSNENGRLTSSYYYQMEKMILNAGDLAAVTSLAPEETGEPVQTSIGYSIFRADGAPAEPDFSDQDMLRTVYNYLLSNEFSQIENYYMGKAEDFAAAARDSGFDAACALSGVERVEVPAFPLNYGGVSVIDRADSGVAGLSAASSNENFLKTAFSLEQGAVSEPIVVGRSIMVLQFTGGGQDDEAEDEDGNYGSAVADEMKNYDAAATQAAILSSPKLKNNLNEVLSEYFLQGE